MCNPVFIETLDGRMLSIPQDEIVDPNTVKRIAGEGMPIERDDKRTDKLKDQKFGDLYINFQVTFPKHLTEAHKLEIEQILTPVTLTQE